MAIFTISEQLNPPKHWVLYARIQTRLNSFKQFYIWNFSSTTFGKVGQLYDWCLKQKLSHLQHTKQLTSNFVTKINKLSSHTLGTLQQKLKESKSRTVTL